MNVALPIAPAYRKAVFEALVIQALIGLFSCLILDGGAIAQICGIALIPFWGGAATLILRHPKSPTRMDIELIRFGYLPLVPMAFILVHFFWALMNAE